MWDTRRIFAVFHPSPIGSISGGHQTGTPRPPAKWAIAVSDVITRPTHFMIAAVSMKGQRRVDIGLQFNDGDRLSIGGDLSTPLLLQADERMAAQARQRSELGQRDRPSQSYLKPGSPCQAMPI